MSFLDILEEGSVVVPPNDVEVVYPPSSTSESVAPAQQITGPRKGQLTKEEEIESNLREMENDLLAEAMKMIQASQQWPKIAKELDPKNPDDIPKEWVEKFGEQGAKEVYRVARAAMMNNADAPTGLKQQVLLATGIMKARAGEKRGPKILNLSLVEMPNVTVNFPETEVKDSK